MSNVLGHLNSISKFVKEIESLAPEIVESKGVWKKESFDRNPPNRSFDLCSIEDERIIEIFSKFCAISTNKERIIVRAIGFYCDRRENEPNKVYINLYKNGKCSCCGSGAHTLASFHQESFPIEEFKQIVNFYLKRECERKN